MMHLGLVKPPVGVDDQDVSGLEDDLKADNNMFHRQLPPPNLPFFCNPTNILEEAAVSTTYDLLSDPQQTGKKYLKSPMAMLWIFKKLK